MKTSSKLFNKIFHIFCVNIVRLRNLFDSFCLKSSWDIRILGWPCWPYGLASKDVVTATYFEWTRCGDASMMGIYLWSEYLAKLTLLCLQHGQHTAGCGDTSMMGLSLWSENSAKLTLFCAPKAPKMLLTALLARASRKTAIKISLRSLGWVDIWISIFGRYLGWAKISISIFGRFCQKQADMALRYGHLEALPTQSGESRYVNVLICT